MADLQIQLDTDYTLHHDFEYVEGTLVRVGKPWKGSQSLIHPAPSKLSDGPAIVMGFRKVKTNKMYHLYLRLLDNNGASVAFRIVHLRVTDNSQVIPVTINKD